VKSVPACATCGYAVEWVRSSYQGEWHLFGDNADAKSGGRYYFAPLGTPHYPGFHNVWSKNWLDQNWRNEVTLGEDLEAKQLWYNGAAPAVLPRATRAGSAACIANGERYALRLVNGAPALMNGFPSACFTQADVRDAWMQIAAIDRCAVQKLFAWILTRMYENNSAAILDVYQQWLGNLGTVTFTPVANSFPALSIVTDPNFTICVCDGTRFFQQFALQAWQSLDSPQNFGILGTMLLWYNASTYVIEQLEARGVTAAAPILLVGHSYGAVVASIVAARLRFANPDLSISLLTFGMPDPGDARLIALMNRCRQIHLVNDVDTVTILPPDFTSLQIIVPLLGPFILGLWGGWERPTNAFEQNADGVLIPRPPTQVDTFLLGFLVSQAISHQTLNAFTGHRIETYFNRIERRCPFVEWPIPAPVNEEINAVLGVRFGGGGLEGNAKAKLKFGGGHFPFVNAAAAIAFDGGGEVKKAYGAPAALELGGGGELAGLEAASIAFDGGGDLGGLEAAALALDGGGQLGGLEAAALALGGEGEVLTPLTPGATCSAAPVVTLGTDYTFSIASGVTHWFKFPATSGVQYKVRCTVNSGSISSVTVTTGTCGSPTFQFILNPPFLSCNTFTPGANTDGMIAVAGPLMGTGNYTIHANTGSCP